MFHIKTIASSQLDLKLYCFATRLISIETCVAISRNSSQSVSISSKCLNEHIMKAMKSILLIQLFFLKPQFIIFYVLFLVGNPFLRDMGYLLDVAYDDIEMRSVLVANNSLLCLRPALAWGRIRTSYIEYNASMVCQ
jgi:hypothetical protein